MQFEPNTIGPDVRKKEGWLSSTSDIPSPVVAFGILEVIKKVECIL
jgi:hypothetical protein